MKYSLILLFMLLLCVLLPTIACSAVNIELQAVTSYTPTPVTLPQFDSPEAAIAAYVDALVRNDIEGVLQSCAVEEMSANFDFAAQVNRLRAMILVPSLAPSNDAFYVALNQAQVTAQLLNQVKLFTYSLLSATPIDGSPLLNVAPEDVQQFIRMVDPTRLAGLQLVAVAWPNREIMKSERYLENSSRQAAIYGADAQTERVTLLAFEGQTYLIGFTLLRFENQWKISNLSSPLGNSSAFGTPQPITPAEFAAQFQE